MNWKNILYIAFTVAIIGINILLLLTFIPFLVPVFFVIAIILISIGGFLKNEENILKLCNIVLTASLFVLIINLIGLAFIYFRDLPEVSYRHFRLFLSQAELALTLIFPFLGILLYALSLRFKHKDREEVQFFVECCFAAPLLTPLTMLLELLLNLL